MNSTDYEKLGAFYLGRPFDLKTGKSIDVPVLYDARDLVTHAVCVGMTGSGKTGLCIGVLEEAAIDGIPAIVIDPKGDLSNLLLTFPNPSAGDFLPWINADDATRKGLTPEQFAQQQADSWRKGLADWGQAPERIQSLKSAADFSIYTPGSTAGTPVSILKSFAVPPAAVLDDAELFGDQVRTAVSGLLGLAGIDADPMQSREHILLSSIVGANWKSAKDVDLGALIQQIQQPPVQRVGVMDVESFFPQKDRFVLAMRLNNLLAAPGFEAWMSGEPLDVGALLRTAQGKPRVSIFSIAHLGDAERMFFVTLLLNQILGWTRSQSGTTSLRAIVYMDEIFGYFPPVSNPPSKPPLLTLLKQARAFGVGVMLATQNPVDLDYKGLANCGTWFIGRLQTERDKQRVLEGLEGAAASASSKFNRSDMEQTLAGLGSRVFLMNNVHEDEPVVFQTRWTLSYLRGPLTRQQIRQLMEARRSTKGDGISKPVVNASVGMELTGAGIGVKPQAGRPVLPPQIRQVFLPVRSPAPSPDAKLIYTPALYGSADVYFVDAKLGLNEQQQRSLLVRCGTGPVCVDWTRATDAGAADSELETEPQANAEFASVPSSISQPKSFEDASKGFADAVARFSKLELFRSAALEQTSRGGEDERAFRARLAQDAREVRDAASEKLRQKYAPKLAALNDRLRRAEQQVDVQKQQASGAKWNTAMTVGASILGAFLGRKTFSAGNISRATSAARGASRVYGESQDVARAQESAGAVQQQLTDLETQFQTELDATASRFDATTAVLDTTVVRPKKTDVKVRLVALAWTPQWQVGQSQTSAY